MPLVGHMIELWDETKESRLEEKSVEQSEKDQRCLLQVPSSWTKSLLLTLLSLCFVKDQLIGPFKQ